MSRSPLLDLSRLGSDGRHWALAPAFSIGAIARAARPAATAAALSAAPVNKAGVGSAAADREASSGRSADRTGRPTVRTMAPQTADRHHGRGDRDERDHVAARLSGSRPAGDRRLALPPRGRAAQAAEQLARGSSRQA